MGTLVLRLKWHWEAALIAALFLGFACRTNAAGCAPPPTGLIGWWPADGNATDLTGANNGILQGGALANSTGLDGLAFNFDGTNGYVQIPDSPGLRPSYFTIEAWVRFSSLDSASSGGSPAGDQYIVFRQNTRSDNFEGFDLSKTRIAGGDVFRFLVAPQSGAPVQIQSATFIATNVWYHIAAVRGTNFTQLYVNGVLQGQATATFSQDYGNYPLYFGTSGQGFWDHKLKGNLDEAAIYLRALSAAEIGAIYTAGAAGKCKGVTITSQPQSQNVSVGSSVLFSVGANGFGTLSYQWRFNGGNIAGATAADFTLNNVQAGNAGNYTVVVSNFAGPVTSVVAVLTVNAANSCVAPAVGLLDWWPGDGTPNDVAGGNNGALQGGATASAAGIYGSAFSFDGTNGYVRIPDSPALRPANLTIEGWVRFSSLDSAGSGGSPAGDQYIVFKQNTRSGDFEGIDLGKTRIGTTDYFQFIVSSASGQSAHLESITAVSTGLWYHVAAVRDANFIRLFVNGQLEGQASVAFPQDYGNFPLYFGTSGQSYWDHKFKGALDEISLYDHALSALEISAIFTAGASGKCKGASITAQPSNQTVAVGANVQFSVGASGLSPLRYQWQFNGANIANATNSALPLNNVQTGNAGNYAVVVTNNIGAVTSSVALLTVLTPPAITAQPQSQTNVVGSIATFSASASGSGPLRYQWQFSGGNIGGATDAIFTVSNVQTTDAGNYRVVVTNSVGAATSAVAALTVWVPPGISSPPQSRTNVVGTSVAFNVIANGTAPLAYQWQFNGANIGGATTANLTIGNVQTSDAGNYSVVVTNVAGSVTSSAAFLTVLLPSAITTQPQSRTNLVGTSAGFSVVANGTAPLNYQWQFNGGNISGATGTSLDLNNVQPSDAGNYSVVVTNLGGAVTSAVAVLTVWVPPSISSQPQSRTNVLGASAGFNVIANGTAPLSYQWQLNGSNIGGATGPNFTLGNVQTSDAGSYTVAVTNSAGSVTSAVAVLTVLVPPAITAQPQSRTNAVGTIAGFSVIATGTAPLSYQWQFNSGNIAGATGTGFALNNVQASDAGNYSVVLTNAGGSITSAVAVLTVWVPPGISSQPQSQTNVVGTSAGFSVAANGTSPLSYQWQFNGGDIGGATGPILNIGNVQPSDAGNYSVVVTNSAGSITSAVALLTVLMPPSISSQPQSRTNVLGTVAGFSAAATGTAPLRYQWQFNSANLPEATGTSLTLTNVQASDAGNYSVIVTNAGGSVTSAIATLTVLVPPAITSPPQSRTNVAGTPASFSVSATGTAPLSFQWQREGENISRATGTSLLLSNVQIGDAANYTVIVTNSAGSVTSAVAVLTVWIPPSVAVQPQNRTNVMGTTALFSVLATGTEPLTYQWQFNGASLSGANGSVLALGNVQPTDAGSYSVVVTNGAGAITSSVVTLTVLLPPTITMQPRSHTNVANIATAFSVAANGTPPIAYQWQFNGQIIPAATGPTLILSNPQVSDSGSYAVVVTNSASATTSAVAILTVVAPTDCVGTPSGLVGWWPGEGNANDVGGTNNGSIQSGANASSAAVAGLGFGFDGVNGFVQIADSPALKPANLTLMCWVRFNNLDSPGNTPSPGQQFVVFKQNSRATNFEGFLLSKERESIGDVFAWTLTSATGQSTKIETVEPIIPNVWYQVAAVRGPDFAQLYLNGELQATASISFPQDYGGTPLYFGSSGQPSFDRKLSGALDEICLFNRVISAAEIAANYFTGAAGMCKVPKITTQPQNVVGYWGGNISFTSSASGALPMKYQWRKDGSALLNATNSLLTLSNLQLSDTANYSLQATNLFGSAMSVLAQLRLNVADVAIQAATAGTQTLAGLNISGVPGKLYGIQVSPDLGASNHWTGFTNIILNSPTNLWIDPLSMTQAQRYYRIVPGPIAISDGNWETAQIGAIWSDDFNRGALGSNWVVLGGANVSITTNNELQFAQVNSDNTRQIYYLPWLTSSDEWTIRWTERFGALDSISYGVGVGIKNFQAAGGNDRGYNALLVGTGPDIGKMQTLRHDGFNQQFAAPGNAIAIAAGDIFDCSLTRSGWTMIACATNRANGQVSTSSLVFSDPANLIAPTISRICFYPIGGTVYLDNISFTINHRKPARFVVIGASASDGYNASSAARRYISVVQSNFFETICNESSSFNTTTNSISLLPEILAHRPTTAILMAGGNDLAFGYPINQWQSQYSNLVFQLQLNGVRVIHTYQTPRNGVDLRPLRDWITSHYPAGDIIDTWTPFVTNLYSLKPIYDSGDGVHPNDAGHLLLGQIIRTNLP